MMCCKFYSPILTLKGNICGLAGRKQRIFFSVPMLTDESVHTARRGGAAARSRSRAGAAVPRSFGAESIFAALLTLN